VAYGALFALTLRGTTGGVAEKIVAVADAKTLGYAAQGAAGFAVALVKAVLCNWMVTLGVALALTSSSTIGKVVCAWLPITVFFAHGFEHLVVNLFVIPTGMMLGAKTGIGSWLLWNALPVTIGNVIGGFVCTGLALYLTYHRKPAAPVRAPRAEAPFPARLEEAVVAAAG
jgi:formate/nitrite transporter FocA (FNT family)